MQVPRQILLGGKLPDDLSRAVDEEDARQQRAADPAVQHRAAAVANARVRDAVLAQPCARVTCEVLAVDADEGDLAAVLLLSPLQALRLVDARNAPGRPEVDH